MKVLILDNYDSFTYNLVQYIEEILGQSIDVRRNDEIALDAVADYDVIVLSPGPGVPSEAGIMPALIQRYASTKHIFGVCLGHQAIGEAFGAKLHNLSEVFHGIETPVRQVAEDQVLFRGVSPVFQAGRYHSWVVLRSSLPAELIVTAEDESGEIMAFRHRDYEVRGVQFHPESIMTKEGYRMLENFFNSVREKIAQPQTSDHATHTR